MTSDYDVSFRSQLVAPSMITTFKDYNRNVSDDDCLELPLYSCDFQVLLVSGIPEEIRRVKTTNSEEKDLVAERLC